MRKTSEQKVSARLRDVGEGMRKTDLCSLELVRYKGLAFHGVLGLSPFLTLAVGSLPVLQPQTATSLPQALALEPWSVTGDGPKVKYV